MEKNSIFIKRGFVYLLGLFIMALGVSISKLSDLGVSPVNSIPNVISEIIHIDMGICTTAVFIGFILIQMIILRKDFKRINLLQILCSFIFGFFVSVTNKMASIILPVCSNYGMKLLYVMISMILIALGILLYLEADILSLPSEGIMKAISFKSGIHISTSKLFFDWSVVIIAAALSIIFMGEFIGVREGTILAAFGVGICLKFFNKYLQKPLQKFLVAVI